MRETQTEPDKEADDRVWERNERPSDYDRPFDESERRAAEHSGLEVGRVRPVLTYALDRPSRAVAVECGTRFAARMSLESWKSADDVERGSAARALQRDIAFRLGVDEHPVEFKRMPGNRMGGYDPQSGELSLNEELLRTSDPKELIMTLAHEQRHVWQQDVVDGRLPHPGGAEAQQRLREGAENYYDDYVDLGPNGDKPAYRWNDLERDGERFAYELYSRYSRGT